MFQDVKIFDFEILGSKSQGPRMLKALNSKCLNSKTLNLKFLTF